MSDCPGYRHAHFALVPLRQADIPQQDFEPGGIPAHRDTRHFGRGERQYGVSVFGQTGLRYGPHLGMLAIRCSRFGERVIPEKMAIADLDVDPPLHSGPQRFSDEAA